MNYYFFVLGTNHTLCKIDVINTLLKQGFDLEIVEASEEILIIGLEEKLETGSLIKELGSAAKIGEVTKIYPKGEKWEDFFEEQKELEKKKIGISVYQAGGKYQELDRVFRKTRNKNKIKQSGRVLSSVEVDKNGLLSEGLELVIAVGTKGIYFGETKALQDYESYSRRDYGRPGRDARSGMIPPKLAKIMINLAGNDKNDPILDPFCGSGTILQELILLGYRQIIGSDREEKAILDTQKNLDWLFQEYKINKELFSVDLIQSEAEKLSFCLKKQVQTIVTEPYLGSSRAKYFSPKEINQEIVKLSILYINAFKEFKKITNPNSTIVIIFPIFRYKAEFFRLDILKELENLGFLPKTFIKAKTKGEELLKLQITSRGSIVYFRPGQSVSREIFVFKKT